MKATRRAAAVSLAGVLGLAGCSVASPARFRAADGAVNVVATISAWGSILAQLGGAHVHATSLVRNPDTDPHDYEPTPADARTIAAAQLIVTNGVGYDSWAAKAVAANADSRQIVVDAGRLLHVRVGANPHRWYSPADVERVADTITAALKRIDPADAAYFDGRRTAFDTEGLAAYHRLIGEIRATYAGTPIGASESIVAPLADALGLDVLTPPDLLRAISEGAEPSARDKSIADMQIRTRRIKVYVVNSQNSTPDVAAQVAAARAHGIPVVAVTETLTPSSASFQQWQVAQLHALLTALRQAAGR